MPPLQAPCWLFEEFEHPLMSLCVAHDERGRVAAVHFLDRRGVAPVAELARRMAGAELRPHAGPPSEAKRQLLAYLEGELRSFDLEIEPRGTAFEREAWAALREIPWGVTRSYKAQAASLGRSAQSARAVGRANANNPIPIIIPCHRVVGSDGSLTGFAGGLEVKARLLAHESPQAELFAPRAAASAAAPVAWPMVTASPSI